MDRCIAMVGSRNASSFSTEATEQIAEELSNHDVTIISGMAMGIDAAAHIGCLRGSSPTAAVLGTGLDVNYPVENEDIRKRLLDQGGVLLTEYVPGTGPRPWNFPVRNRIMSGLSRAVLMMECQLKSGSIRTIQHALDQGKEVYAFPGKVRTHWEAGAHQLLREGANYFTCAQDIL